MSNSIMADKYSKITNQFKNNKISLARMKRLSKQYPSFFEKMFKKRIMKMESEKNRN